MNIVEFLKERIYEDGYNAVTPKEVAEAEFKLRVIDCHSNWPILIEEEPKVSIQPTGDLNDFTLTMTTRVVWVYEDEYIERFGKTSPTPPMIRAMANVYSDHPDFNPEWKIEGD